MPKDFQKCVDNGGKVRTKDIDDKYYMYVCFPKGGGSSIAGEIHKRKRNDKDRISSSGT
jgi:tartrate dehydratase alpha subunit/fumarate hydratase class I-like protein